MIKVVFSTKCSRWEKTGLVIQMISFCFQITSKWCSFVYEVKLFPSSPICNSSYNVHTKSPCAELWYGWSIFPPTSHDLRCKHPYIIFSWMFTQQLNEWNTFFTTHFFHVLFKAERQQLHHDVKHFFYTSMQTTTAAWGLMCSLPCSWIQYQGLCSLQRGWRWQVKIHNFYPFWQLL